MRCHHRRRGFGREPPTGAPDDTVDRSCVLVSFAALVNDSIPGMAVAEQWRCPMTLRRVFAFALAMLLVSGVANGQTAKEIHRARGTESFEDTFPCVGELHGEFKWQDTVSEWTDGKGGFHYRWGGTVSNLTAIDADGSEYSGSQTWNITYHVGSNEAFPMQDMDVEKISLVSRGRAPNLLWRIRMHITINAPGEVRVQRSLDSVECVGR